MFFGAEVMIHGFNLIANPLLLIWLIMLYLIIFAVADDLIARFRLSDRHAMLMAAAMAIILGGIGNQEMYETDPSAALTLLRLNMVSVVLDSVSWGIYLIWVMHVIRQLVPRRNGSSLMTWRGWAGVSLLFLTMAVNYFSNVRRPERAAEDALLLLLAIAVAALLGLLVRHRRPERCLAVEASAVKRSRAIILLCGSLVAISIAVVLLGLEYVLPIPLNIILFFIIYMPVSLVILARRRIAI